MLICDPVVSPLDAPCAEKKGLNVPKPAGKHRMVPNDRIRSKSGVQMSQPAATCAYLVFDHSICRTALRMGWLVWVW